MTTATVAALEPLNHELDQQEQDDAYAAWIRAELTRRMAVQEEYYPHEQVMVEMKAIIESKMERG